VSARERILATASELFYREGVRAIGVDTIVERSGVSKTTLYRLFDSKDGFDRRLRRRRDRSFWHGGITLRSSTPAIHVLCWTRSSLRSRGGSHIRLIAAVRS